MTVKWQGPAPCLVTILSLLLTAVSGTSGLWAQEAPGTAAAGPTQLQPRAQQWAEVRSYLMRIMSYAFDEYPELAEGRDALEDAVARAMLTIDPETEVRRARMIELEEAYNAGQGAPGAADLDALLEEGRGVNQALRATEAEARQRPDVVALAEAFQRQLMIRLIEVDPAVMALLDADRRMVGAIWAETLGAR